MAASRLLQRTTARDLREELGLSRERMARLFDVSAKTIERWELRDSLPPGTAARLRFSQVQQIAELGVLVYGVEGLNRFLSTPLSEFDRVNGLQLIEMGQADRVIAALAADYEGLGA